MLSIWIKILSFDKGLTGSKSIVDEIPMAYNKQLFIFHALFPKVFQSKGIVKYVLVVWYLYFIGK